MVMEPLGLPSIDAGDGDLVEARGINLRQERPCLVASHGMCELG